MDVHKNARSCPASRALLFKRVSELAWSVRAASEAAGMSDRRAREWVRRANLDESCPGELRVNRDNSRAAARDAQATPPARHNSNCTRSFSASVAGSWHAYPTHT
jgi:hypothetical protein